MTLVRKAVLRSVRLDDDVWERVKAMECSLNQYLRSALLDSEALLEPRVPISAGGGAERVRQMTGHARPMFHTVDDFEPVPVVDKRPKNCRCRHCGKGFAGPRFSQICGECKSMGHTLSPNECPACNEGSAI